MKWFKNLSLSLFLIVLLATPVSARNTTQQNFQRAEQQIKHLPLNQQHGTKIFHYGHTIYRIYITQPPYQHLTNFQIKQALYQMRKQTYFDINHERHQHHLKSLHYNYKLNILANIRAHQIITNFSHYNKAGVPMTTLDAKQAKLPKHFQGSENIATSGLGACQDEHNPKHYYNHNGYDMANEANESMMNYDQFENNGHRKNILAKYSTLIGIGTAYNAKRHTFYLVENFGNTNNNDSEDIKPYKSNPNPINTQSKPTKQEIKANRHAMKSSWQEFIQKYKQILMTIIAWFKNL